MNSDPNIFGTCVVGVATSLSTMSSSNGLRSILQVVSDSFPGLDGSGLELGINGGALAFNLDSGGMGLGLVPLEFNSDTGVVGGFLGY